MITKIGDLINRVTTSVRQFGIDPHSEVVVRIGEFGQEMPIEHLKVAGAFERKLILQVKAPS